LNDGFVIVFQPPCLHFFVWSPVVGCGTWRTPLTEIFVRSAVPCWSISTLTSVIVPSVFGGNCGERFAGPNVYVAVPSPLITGVTLLQPAGSRSLA
jgi:hypothetical protein